MTTTASRLFLFIAILAIFASLIVFISRPTNTNLSTSISGVSVLQNKVTIAWSQVSMNTLPPEDAKAIANGVQTVQELVRSWNDDCLKKQATNSHLRQYVKSGAPPQKPIEVKIALDEFCGGNIDERGSKISEALKDLKERFANKLEEWNLAVDIIFDLIH